MKYEAWKHGVSGSGVSRSVPIGSYYCNVYLMCIFLEFFMNWWYIDGAFNQGISKGYSENIS